MRKNRYIIIVGIVCLIAIASCNTHSKLLKSTDNELKYQAAMNYFKNKDYNRALQLFDVLQSAYRGKPEGEEIAFYTAECYYNQKEYEAASYYYKRYVVNYPFTERSEPALFRSACCYYLESPNISLDQTATYTAIDEFKNFLEVYPESKFLDSANVIIDTLEYKLQEKYYNICMLYYKMDEYQAAITSFEIFLRDYPNSIHREDIINYMVLTYYKYAINSVDDKKRERFELALEKYNTLSYMYPNSKYVKQLEPTVKKIESELSLIKTE